MVHSVFAAGLFDMCWPSYTLEELSNIIMIMLVICYSCGVGIDKCIR